MIAGKEDSKSMEQLSFINFDRALRFLHPQTFFLFHVDASSTSVNGGVLSLLFKSKIIHLLFLSFICYFKIYLIRTHLE